MIRRKPKRDRSSDGEHSIVIARETQHELLRRGLYVPLRELEQRPFQQSIDAYGWARHRRPTSLLPPWLAELVAAKVAAHLAGWCRNCGAYYPGIAYARPVPSTKPDVFAWADPSESLCVQCVSTHVEPKRKPHHGD